MDIIYFPIYSVICLDCASNISAKYCSAYVNIFCCLSVIFIDATELWQSLMWRVAVLLELHHAPTQIVSIRVLPATFSVTYSTRPLRSVSSNLGEKSVESSYFSNIRIFWRWVQTPKYLRYKACYILLCFRMMGFWEGTFAGMLLMMIRIFRTALRYENSSAVCILFLIYYESNVCVSSKLQSCLWLHTWVLKPVVKPHIDRCPGWQMQHICFVFSITDHMHGRVVCNSWID